MMRRIVAITTLLMMLFTVVPLQAFAAYDKDLERAISLSKSLFKIPKEYDTFDYSMHKDKDKTMFNLRWSGSKGNVGDISVSIDSEGKVNNYYSYKPYTGREKKLPSVSKSDAQKIANDFLRKVNPTVINKVQYQENNIPLNINEGSYRFFFTRVEKGITYPENNVNVEVDSRTGDVRSYYSNWHDEVVFPAAEGAMDLEKAKKEYMNKLGLKLVYKLNYDQKEQKPYLVYTNVYNNQFLDAITGEVVNGNGYFGYPGAYDKSLEMESGGRSNEATQPSLTPQEQKAVEGAAGIMDQAEAEKAARNVLKVNSEYKLNYISLYNNWQNKDEYQWSMDFSKENKSSERYEGINISIDAKTAEVLSFNRYAPYDSATAGKYTKEQSQKAAENFIKTLQPKEFAECELTPWSEPIYEIMDSNELPRHYYFNFMRKANGAYFLGNGFNLTVDSATGEVNSYSFNWYKKELPATEKALTREKAHEILYKEIGIQLQYISLFRTAAADKIMPPAPEGGTPKLGLVYTLKPGKPVNIDANSGALLDYNGKPLGATQVASYEDIKGHYAENQIKILAEYAISLPGKKLQPEKTMTQREFLYLLLRATNPWVSVGTLENLDEDALYKNLIAANIVKEGERKPGATVQRQDAVKFLVRALNYDRVAEIDSKIFKLPFKDANKINKGLYGYMAVGYGLNLISGRDGYCDPTSNLTRGQGFVFIYNFLNV